MGIKLPRWEDLSRDEQVPIYNLSLEGNYVVVGGPGTGKTILALYRAARWKKEMDNGRSQFLVYNKPLQIYLKSAIKAIGLDSSESQTYHSWVHNFYKNTFKKNAPQIAPYMYDWDKINAEIRQHDFVKPIQYLILDEAQDFPIGLLEMLQLLSENTTIFGDTAQALSEKTTLADITRIFGAGRRTQYLTKNYRNTKEISQVGHLFYTGSKNDIPEATIKFGDKPLLIKAVNTNSIYKYIDTYASNNPAESIGILVGGNKTWNVIDEYYKNIDDNRIENKNNYKIEKYKSSRNKESNITFENQGIKIMSFNTMKGLEFDAVFIVNIDDSYFFKEDESKLKKVFVASTRANTNLFYTYIEDNDSFIIKMLKDNNNLIRTKKI